jgi:sugar (pentulose or hexulose) kinase
VSSSIVSSIAAGVAGIDLGTSSCKVGIFAAAGSVLGMGQAAFAIERGADGRAELDSGEWWPRVCAAVRQALAQAGAEVSAVGVSGQVGTHLLLDAAGQPVRPALSWQDTRSGAEALRLHERLGGERLRAALGIDLPPSPAWPLPRLLWLQRHAPADLARTRHLLQMKDYIVHCLTGEWATDASSWRGLLRLPGSELATDLLRELGLPADLLPPRRAPWAVIGAVTPAAAEATGLRAGLPVVTGWHDLNCALLGSGVTRPGQGFDLGGTSEHVGVALGAHGPAERAAGLMLAPYLSAQLGSAARVCYGVTSAGGGALDWYANEFARGLLRAHGLDLPADFGARLEALAAGASPGADGLLFLPYLSGERAPIWDANARGVFFGLTRRHGHAHLARAVLEGVAYSLRQVLEAVEAVARLRVERLRASGGPAEVGAWNQIKADVLGRPLSVPRVTHAACLGAAMLAAIGLGWHADADQAAQAMVQARGEVIPNVRHAERYAALYSVYTDLYPRLRTAFADLARIATLEDPNA